MSSPSGRHVLLINIAVLFISTSGPLGRYIQMAPPATIWWRCLLGTIVLFVVVKALKHPTRLAFRKIGLPVMGAGVLLGIHWITYFYALQVSNVAIGLLSLFSYPLFTALLEPVLLGTKFQSRQLVLAIICLLGLYLLVPDLDLASGAMQGVLWGTVSAICYAIRNIILKKQIADVPGTTLMLFQLLTCTILFWPVLFYFDPGPIVTEWPWVALLAVITTAGGHTLFVISLRYFSVSTTSIISSTQPVFGVILGMIFLGEIPALNTVAGGALILFTVVMESILSRRSAKPKVT